MLPLLSHSAHCCCCRGASLPSHACSFERITVLRYTTIPHIVTLWYSIGHNVNRVLEIDSRPAHPGINTSVISCQAYGATAPLLLTLASSSRLNIPRVCIFLPTNSCSCLCIAICSYCPEHGHQSSACLLIPCCLSEAEVS